MTISPDALARLKNFGRVSAMRARLAPLRPLVRDYLDAFEGVNAKLQPKRGRSKALRKQRAAEFLEKIKPLDQIVLLVARSDLLIAKLNEQVQRSEDGSYDYDKAALVDSLWIQIRTLREIVPKAEQGARVAAWRSKGGKTTAAKLKPEVEERAKKLRAEAAKIEKMEPGIKKEAVAAMLADRGYGKKGTIVKKLPLRGPAKNRRKTA